MDVVSKEPQEITARVHHLPKKFDFELPHVFTLLPHAN